MRCILAVTALVVLAGCQGAGYTPGDIYSFDCSASPIKSSWSNAYTPSYEQCYRATFGGIDTAGHGYVHPFQIPGGDAVIVYSEASPGTYLTQRDPQNVASMSKTIADGASNWSRPYRMTAGEKPYSFANFQMDSRPCIAFVGYDAPAGWAPGFRRMVSGYACANRLKQEDAVRLLESMSYDVARTTSAELRPFTPPPPKAPKTPQPSVVAPASATLSPSIDQRLTALKDLHERKLITSAEYEAKRKEILDKL
ncbi:SHOCT domain-containing protein [Azospirillum sp.]|uniref:SHOCT domain-containing protein n=1 Tax=Azospirillum sp. TaxID=34012 RepID=UPI003D73E7AE